MIDKYVTNYNNNPCSANQLTATQSAHKVRLETEIQNGTQLQKPHATTMDPNKKEKFKKTLPIHCRHDRKLEALKYKMHRLFYSISSGTPTMNIKPRVGYTNSRSVERRTRSLYNRRGLANVDI